MATRLNKPSVILSEGERHVCFTGNIDRAAVEGPSDLTRAATPVAPISLSKSGVPLRLERAVFAALPTGKIDKVLRLRSDHAASKKQIHRLAPLRMTGLAENAARP